jgi:GTP cyclohydrolase I
MKKRRKPALKRRRAADRHRFDLEAMARSIRAFLQSAGMDLKHPQLARTPERVAQAWYEDFLDGYRADPAELLRTSFAAEGGRAPATSEMVVVKAIPFHGMCPHHLLPYQGLAHIGYLPNGRLAPFSGLVRLLDCYAHRLEVQETITRQVADALLAHLQVRGAACVLESEQACVSLRGVKRRGSRIVTSHFAGQFATRGELRSEFLRSIGKLD